LGLAFLTITIILISKKINKNIPLPPFQLMNTFNFLWVFDLMGGAVAIAIAGLVEAISINFGAGAKTKLAGMIIVQTCHPKDCQSQ
jgi:hypothetical protein